MTGNLTRLRVAIAVAMLATISSGCALIGWNCLRAQKRGKVIALNGEIDAGRIVSHLVPYDQPRLLILSRPL